VYERCCRHQETEARQDRQSTGVILPKEVLDRLNLSAGDQLTCTQAPGGITLSSRGDDFDSQMAAARDVMKRDRNGLRELAK
jgi:putative addiction module antidote